jgi:hypothetical protein
MFIRNKKVHDRQLTGIAYRNNGSVTLGTSTKYSNMHWDLVCKNPHDRKNSQSVEWRKTSWMNPMGTLTDADKSLLDISLETEPVTTVGANAGWFLLRGYSIGSSTADGFIGILNRCSTATKESEENTSLFNVARPIFNYITRNLNETVQEEWDGDDDGNDEAGQQEQEDPPNPNNDAAEEVPAAVEEGPAAMAGRLEAANEEEPPDIDAAMRNAAADSPEYVRLMVKKVENAPTDDPFIVILLEHIELPDEMHDEVSNNKKMMTKTLLSLCHCLLPLSIVSILVSPN